MGTSLYTTEVTVQGVIAGMLSFRISLKYSLTARPPVSFPTIFGNGCIIQYVAPKFWADYVILLIHETGKLVP